MNTMKSPPINAEGQQGSTLLMTVVITALIGFLLAAYLTLVTSQNGANARSQGWNSAMPVVEAGVEEALAHLNTPRGMTNGPLNVDGWEQSGTTYTISRNIGESRYIVRILNYVVGDSTVHPYVESRGYVQMPRAIGAAQGPLMAQANGGTLSVSYLARGVRAKTHRDFIFSKGMVAKDSIDLNGNNIATDSFDSTDPNYSTDGKYDPTKANDNGDIAVNSSLTNSMSVGNANIAGHVSVGPGGSIEIGQNGSVGSAEWLAAGNKGIEPGWSKDDMNVSFDDVIVFSGGQALPGGGWVTNTTYTVTSSNAVGATVYAYPAACAGTVSTNTVTANNYPIGHPGPVTTNKNVGGQITGYTYNSYVCSTVVSTTNAVITATYYDYVFDKEVAEGYSGHTLSGTVYIGANVKVFITDTLEITAMTIKRDASLNLYSSAPVVKLAGNTSANSDGIADSFAFWGTKDVKEVTFSGNANFVGTIYAPEANFTLNGSGNEVIDFVGASITKSVTMNGHFNFHYDEALRKKGPFRAYIVTGWNEMTPTEISAIGN